MRTNSVSTLLAPIALLWALATAAPAQIEVPANDGWVTDLAGMLTPAQERQLETTMESYRAGTTHEIALLTVPNLGGEPIERFALEVARAWRIGRERENNGALLVVSRDDRKLRIEVGRGLEGTLTDSISGRIIRNVIAPEFKRGQYFEGLRDGIAATHAAIGGDYGKIPEQAPRSGRSSFGRLALMLFMFVVFMVISAARGGGGRGGRRGGRRGSSWPWWFLAGSAMGSAGRRGGSGGFGGGLGGGGFGGFGGGGGFSGGGASGGW